MDKRLGIGYTKQKQVNDLQDLEELVEDFYQSDEEDSVILQSMQNISELITNSS